MDYYYYIKSKSIFLFAFVFVPNTLDCAGFIHVCTFHELLN